MRNKKAKMLRRIAENMGVPKETTYKEVKGTGKVAVWWLNQWNIVSLSKFSTYPEDARQTAQVAFTGQKIMNDCVRKEYRKSKYKLKS